MMNTIINPAIFQHAATVVISNWILWWGIWRFVPDTLNNYGFDFCGWKRYRRQNTLGGLLLLTFGNFIMGAATKATSMPFSALSAVGAILLFVSMWGVFRLDRAFQIIPDRFHLSGFLGAAIFTAGKITRNPADWTTIAVYCGLGLLLPVALLGLNLTYRKIRGTEGLGTGDLKTLTWFAVAFQENVWLSFVAACLLAIVMQCLKLIVSRRMTLQSTFAFGPFLICGTLLVNILQLLNMFQTGGMSH